MKSNYDPTPPRKKKKHPQFTGPGQLKPGQVPTFEDGSPIPWSHPRHPRFKKPAPKPGNY